MKENIAVFEMDPVDGENDKVWRAFVVIHSSCTVRICA